MFLGHFGTILLQAAVLFVSILKHLLDVTHEFQVLCQRCKKDRLLQPVLLSETGGGGGGGGTENNGQTAL